MKAFLQRIKISWNLIEPIIKERLRRENFQLKKLTVKVSGKIN
jgi:hypothetical protein